MADKGEGPGGQGPSYSYTKLRTQGRKKNVLETLFSGPFPKPDDDDGNREKSENKQCLMSQQITTLQVQHAF